MFFTEGKSQEYERMMREKPGFVHPPIKAKTHKERDCPHCLYFDKETKNCGLDGCLVFQCYAKGGVCPLGHATSGMVASSLPPNPQPSPTNRVYQPRKRNS